MFRGQLITLIFPAYNEEANIGQAIKDFKAVNFYDEILVIDNNSIDKTAELSKRSGATVIKETKQGYGFALRRGLKEAKGDLIMLCEPDGTFKASDSKKLISLTDKADLVMGTRTNKQYIQKGANMGFLLRWGNITIAKTIQFLFHTPAITDCGCTFRIFKRSLAQKLNSYFTVGGHHFLPETVILSTLVGASIYEIPIHYQPRIGRSKITGSLKRSILVACRMLKLAFWYKYLTLINRKIPVRCCNN